MDTLLNVLTVSELEEFYKMCQDMALTEEQINVLSEFVVRVSNANYNEGRASGSNSF